MSKVPFRFDELDINNFCYTDIKVSSKKTIIYMKYMDNHKLKNIVFQTPSFISTNFIQNKNNIFELDVPLLGKEPHKIDKFKTFLHNIDKKIIKDAKNNNKWFENFANIKTMKYQRIIRDSTDIENKNGVIRLKLLRTNDFETIIHHNNSKINIEEISKDCWLKCILEIYAIWINENGFGLFIRPILLSFKPSMKVSYNYKLIDESDEGEQDNDIIETVNDNSVFIRSENEITSSVLEMPNANSSEEIIENNYDSTTSSDN
jgi:hypothetical protein